MRLGGGVFIALLNTCGVGAKEMLDELGDHVVSRLYGMTRARTRQGDASVTGTGT